MFAGEGRGCHKIGETPVLMPVYKSKKKKRLLIIRINLLSDVTKIYRLINRNSFKFFRWTDSRGTCVVLGMDEHVWIGFLIVKMMAARKKDGIACFLDLEKGYDRVQREKLCKAFESYGINGFLLKAVKLFYRNNITFVKIKWRGVVWNRSRIKTRLFNIFINIRDMDRIRKRVEMNLHEGIMGK